MELSKIELFFEPKDRLRMTHVDRSWHTVVPRWSSPLTHPGKYLALLDLKGNEIVMINDLTELSETSRDAVTKEVETRYLTAQVEEVLFTKGELASVYWTVQTERGVREFVTQNLSENAQWLGPNHILLTDVDGNRFEIRDTTKLSGRSLQMIEAIL